MKYGASFPRRWVTDALEFAPSQGHLFPSFQKSPRFIEDRNANLLFRQEGWRSYQGQKGGRVSQGRGAIEHSKELAKRLRLDGRAKDPALLIIVVDESGTEVHREPVYPEQPNPGLSFGNTG